MDINGTANVKQFHANQSVSRDDFEFSPGLSTEEMIAHLQGKIARQRFETDVIKRRMQEVESENKRLQDEVRNCYTYLTCRQANVKMSLSFRVGTRLGHDNTHLGIDICVFAALSFRFQVARLSERSDDTSSETDSPKFLKRRRRQSKGSSYSDNVASPIRKACSVETKKTASQLRLEIAEQLKLLRSDLTKILDESEHMMEQFYDHLKDLRHFLYSHLDPKYVMKELVSRGYASIGWVSLV